MTILVGDNTETSIRSPSLQGIPSIFATEFTAAAGGICTEGWVYTSNTSGTLYMVVYDANGDLVAQSNAVELSATITGWVQFTFGQFAITAGSQYWVGTYANGYGWNLGLGAVGSAIYDNNGGTYPTAPATTDFTVRGTGYVSVTNNFSVYLVQNTTIPTVTGVNGGNPITEGSTGVVIDGTNFASAMTAHITQPNGVSVSVPVTYVSATEATFDLTAAVMEPVAGAALAATDAFYTTDITVTLGANTTTPFSIAVAPAAGVLARTLTAVNPNPAVRIETIPDLEVNYQIWAAGDAAGTSAAPTGLVLNADGSFEFAPGYTPQDFWVRVYIAANSAYTPWAEITVTGSQSGGFW